MSRGTAGVPEGVLLESNGISRDLTTTGSKDRLRRHLTVADLTRSVRIQQTEGAIIILALAHAGIETPLRCCIGIHMEPPIVKRMVRVPGADLPPGRGRVSHMPANGSFPRFRLESGHSAFGQRRSFHFAPVPDKARPAIRSHRSAPLAPD